LKTETTSLLELCKDCRDYKQWCKGWA